MIPPEGCGSLLSFCSTCPGLYHSVNHFSVVRSLIHSSQWLLQSRPLLMYPQHKPGSVKFSSTVMSDYLRPHGLQHARASLSITISQSLHKLICQLSWWCHPTVSFSAIPFFSNLQSFPASGSFPMSQQLFTSDGQSIGVSASTSVLQWIARTELL